MLLWCAITLAAEPKGLVVRPEGAHVIAAGLGTATLLLGPANGSSKAALDTLTFQVGATVPAHVHAESDELLYVMTGSIALAVGGTALVASAGEAVLIPAGVEHSAHCTAAATLVQVYVGPGPEERFRAAPLVTPP